MSESSHYPNGRDFCSYARFIKSAKKDGRRYGFGRDSENGAMGLFIEIPMVTPSGRYSRKSIPVCMRATGILRQEKTSITWNR